MSKPKDWSTLSIKAWKYLVANPQVQGYKGVAEEIGTNPLSARYALAYILEFCERENLPALTALVQNQQTKRPGDGFRIHVKNKFNKDKFYFNNDKGFDKLYANELKRIKIAMLRIELGRY
ncbi:hypothetical protein [Vibrio owensii]|uniref:hypothetical protein n=1 Tax=Vibrio owensii TaxID=696485 RepID=UPI003DA17CC9